MRTTAIGPSLVALSILAGSLASVGCSTSADPTQHTGPLSAHEASNRGKAGFDITVGGVTVDSVSYHVTGNGQDVQDTIEVMDPNATISFEVGLPAGNNYQVTLHADSTDAP